MLYHEQILHAIIQFSKTMLWKVAEHPTVSKLKV